MKYAKKVVEAILFSTTKPFSIREIAKMTGMSVEEAEKSIRELIKDYSNRETSIEIIELGGKYLMRVKPRYHQYIENFVEKDLDRGSLRTLAVIALKQPLPLSKLAKIRGNKCYEHVRKLVDIGFVRTKKAGRTSILSTTKEFAIYFGLDSTNPEDIRSFLRNAAKTDSELEKYIEI
ncbi:MAG TPA: SMC-Scp complex subunit ScpB [Archaeoglobaceae archaeon]|nr:SMC-Scp complex subunit ScpB [Archaeoglobaceae archaeon]